MWNLSCGATETLLELAEERLERLGLRITGDSADDQERQRLDRAVAELNLLRSEQLPMRQRIVLGLTSSRDGSGLAVD